MPIPASLLLAGAIALIVAGYVRASRKDIDATTEVAAIVVLGAGVLGGLGLLRLSAALTTLTVLLLAEKPRLHGFVERLDELTLLAAARFAVMSIVILPLLPEGPFGPGPGIKPRELWMLVLLFSGLSFVGYLAQRMSGAAGYPLTGLARRPGVVHERHADVRALEQDASATGRPARRRARSPRAPCCSSVSRLPSRSSMRRSCRCWRVTSSRRYRRASWPSPWRGDRCAATKADAAALKNPLQLRSAIEMALLFQVVLYARATTCASGSATRACWSAASCSA